MSTHHDWPVKKAINHLPITLNGKLKRTSHYSLNPLGPHNKHLGAASQALLTGVKLRLRRRATFGTKESGRCRAVVVEERFKHYPMYGVSVEMADSGGSTVFLSTAYVKFKFLPIMIPKCFI